MNKLLLTHLINIGGCATIGIVDTILRSSILPFFSWSFIAGWIAGTLYYFERLVKYKRLHARYNHWFFLFWPNFLGTVTLAFGAFCVVFNYSLLGPFHFSVFTVFFALPYLIVGCIFFSKALKQYQFIHVNGKEKNARVIGFIFLPIFIMVLFFIAILVHTVDVLALAFGIVNLIVLLERIVYNATHESIAISAGATRSPPARAPRSTRARSPRSSRTRTPSRTPPPPSTPETIPLLSASAASPAASRPIIQTPSRSNRSRRNSSRHRRSQQQAPARPTRSRRNHGSSHASFQDKIAKNIRELLPTGANIDLNDFKCLFCFDLLNRQERNRKIIICERCKRPAHLDEWNAWKSTSSNCPRCNAPVNGSSKIVTISVYKKVIAFFTKHKAKFRGLVLVAPRA